METPLGHPAWHGHGSHRCQHHSAGGSIALPPSATLVLAPAPTTCRAPRCWLHLGSHLIDNFPGAVTRWPLCMTRAGTHWSEIAWNKTLELVKRLRCPPSCLRCGGTQTLPVCPHTMPGTMTAPCQWLPKLSPLGYSLWGVKSPPRPCPANWRHPQPEPLSPHGAEATRRANPARPNNQGRESPALVLVPRLGRQCLSFPSG